MVNDPRRDSAGPPASHGSSMPPDLRKKQEAAKAIEISEPGAPSFKLAPAEVIALLAARPELLRPGLSVPKGEVSASGQLTEVGQIDLLFKDSAGGWLVVMVPESDSGGDFVVEILHRIGWVRKHRAEAGRSVRGVVLLPDDTGPAGYAAVALAETVEFKTYRMALRFEACSF